MQFAKRLQIREPLAPWWRVPLKAEEQKRAIHRQRERLVQARKRLEAPVITPVYRERCGRYGNIANDVAAAWTVATTNNAGRPLGFPRGRSSRCDRDSIVTVGL